MSLSAADEICERLRQALMFGKANNSDASQLSADCLRMLEDLAVMQRFIKGLSEGDLSSELHVKGRMAGSLKALQANLRHLTWQVQQVAAGDLSQKVDFMGDFSAAFNSMIDYLGQTQRYEREMREMAESLREATADLNRALSMEEVLDSVATFAPNLAGADALDVLTVSGGMMRIRRSAGRLRDTQEEMSALDQIAMDLPAHPIFSSAGESNQALTKVSTSGAAIPGYPQAAWAHAALVVPMVVEGQVFGFICVLREDAREFSPLIVQRLAFYTNQAGIAVSKARLVDMLSWYASTDPLTGVPNRRNFFQRAEHELDRARRYRHPVSFLLIDIDHFKQINDRYGHTVGDHALSETAAVCVESLRTSDTIGRLGGEEFAVLLPETGGECALAIAERLRQAIAESSFPAENEQVRVTASFGVAVWDGEESLHNTLIHADQAMYQAKSEGRNRVVLYSPGRTQ